MQRHKVWEGVSFQTGFRPGGKDWDVRLRAQCFPPFAILSAMNITTLDYFAFDIEGAELAVLKTIPFDKVIFKVISVEALNVNVETELKQLMESKGYRFKKLVHEGYANDLVFVHKSLSV